MFKTFLKEVEQNEAVAHEEDKAVLKKFKKLLNEAYQYGYRNLESDWASGSVLHTLQEAIDYSDKLKGV